MATEKRLIDGNAFKGKLIRELNKTGKYTAYECGLDDALSYLEMQPTVDAVEVVRGWWKNVKETEVYSPDHRCTFTHTAQTCSVCNVRIGFIGAKFYLYDGYCPNCNAKMDGDGNG